MWNDVVLWISLGVNAISDLKSRFIYVGINIFLAALGILGHILTKEGDIADLILGIVIGLFVLAIAYFSREAVGIGDGIVVLSVGIIAGGRKTLTLLMSALCLTAIFGIFLLCIKKGNRKTELAFMPFMLLSFIICKLGGFV